MDQLLRFGTEKYFSQSRAPSAQLVKQHSPPGTITTSTTPEKKKNRSQSETPVDLPPTLTTGRSAPFQLFVITSAKAKRLNCFSDPPLLGQNTPAPSQLTPPDRQRGGAEVQEKHVGGDRPYGPLWASLHNLLIFLHNKTCLGSLPDTHPQAERGGGGGGGGWRPTCSESVVWVVGWPAFPYP
ncbi:hypothetical protein EYF80_024307 [Liparis tanakae]|uniref:Uncharacterized protein n=1 Tax=Liparis tanakae TaxID=230148 RepID=A0A4Z2HI29_9TELE|nr:hypothetical protein EYF80_024307 [Liparis tanakae]